MRAGSVVVSFAAASLLGAAFWTHHYGGVLFTSLLLLVLLSLCAAIGLHIYFLVLMKRNHRRTADALSQTEHEFKAIFENLNDAVLILDGLAVCVQANPAAQALFAVPLPKLIGSQIGKLIAGGGLVFCGT